MSAWAGSRSSSPPAASRMPARGTARTLSSSRTATLAGSRHRAQGTTRSAFREPRTTTSGPLLERRRLRCPSAPPPRGATEVSSNAARIQAAGTGKSKDSPPASRSWTGMLNSRFSATGGIWGAGRMMQEGAARKEERRRRRAAASVEPLGLQLFQRQRDGQLMAHLIGPLARDLLQLLEAIGDAAIQLVPVV